MKKSFLVVGLGRFGSNVAKKLEELNFDVIGVDVDEESVTQISKLVPHVFIADGSKEDVLENIGAKSVDHAVVAIGNNLQASIMTIINLKKLGVEKITVRADNDSHKQVYQLLGANEVIIPEEASAVSLANQIISDSILDYYEVAKDYVLVKLTVAHTTEKNLIEMDLRNKFGINIVGIIKNSDEFFIPRGTDKLLEGEVVVVCGDNAKISKFNAFLND